MGRNYSDITGANHYKYAHGYTTKGSKRPGFYNSWQNMKARCFDRKHPKYPRYGGRGVKVYEGWLGIDGFSEWALKNGWKQGLALDRIDNDGNYEPSNCKWVSVSENSRKKSTRKITFDEAQEIRKRLNNGENEYILAKEYGVVHGTIWFIKNECTHIEEGEYIRKRNYIMERNFNN